MIFCVFRAASLFVITFKIHDQCYLTVWHEGLNKMKVKHYNADEFKLLHSIQILYKGTILFWSLIHILFVDCHSFCPFYDEIHSDWESWVEPLRMPHLRIDEIKSKTLVESKSMFLVVKTIKVYKWEYCILESVRTYYRIIGSYKWKVK